MSIPVLASANPVTVPAKVYDRVWVQEVVIAAPDPNGDATARICLRNFCVTDGVAELEPAAGVWLEVKDVLAGAAADPALAEVVQAIMAYVAKVGREQGHIAPAAE
jgi:hypothetical protein